MAIPDDMERMPVIIEKDYIKEVVRYGQSDGRRMSRSAAARRLILIGLRAVSFLPGGSEIGTDDAQTEQRAA